VYPHIQTAGLVNGQQTIFCYNLTSCGILAEGTLYLTVH
jgi:hypothetical protein